MKRFAYLAVIDLALVAALVYAIFFMTASDRPAHTHGTIAWVIFAVIVALLVLLVVLTVRTARAALRREPA